MAKVELGGHWNHLPTWWRINGSSPSLTVNARICSIMMCAVGMNRFFSLFCFVLSFSIWLSLPLVVTCLFCSEWFFAESPLLAEPDADSSGEQAKPDPFWWSLPVSYSHTFIFGDGHLLNFKPPTICYKLYACSSHVSNAYLSFGNHPLCFVQEIPTLFPSTKLMDLKRNRLWLGILAWVMSHQKVLPHVFSFSSGREALHAQGLLLPVTFVKDLSETQMSDLAGNMLLA